MSVTAIGSAQTPSPYVSPLYVTPSSDPTQSASPAKPKSQFRSDFTTLLNDVQSGDMTSAKQALAAVQSDISAANATYSPQSTSSSSSSTTQLPPDLQNLFNAVQSGDTTAAQSALTKLQSDAPQRAGAGGAHGHHHHHASGGATDADASSTSTSTATLDPFTASTTSSSDPALSL